MSDIEHHQLLCELVKPTVDVAELGRPLEPLGFVTAEGGRSVFAVGMLTFGVDGGGSICEISPVKSGEKAMWFGGI